MLVHSLANFVSQFETKLIVILNLSRIVKIYIHTDENYYIFLFFYLFPNICIQIPRMWSDCFERTKI